MHKSHEVSGVRAVAGAGVMALRPRAVLAYVTTYGKAGMGVAIKTLKGVAAKKAALAWLGRGPLAAGGKMIVGGKALLAFAGPVGWIDAGGSTSESM
jgi:uncharacterized protein YaaW (UPF0174 family)